MSVKDTLFARNYMRERGKMERIYSNLKDRYRKNIIYSIAYKSNYSKLVTKIKKLDLFLV